MTSDANKNRLMWLLVVLCTAGIVLAWLPNFFNTVWDFSDAITKKGQISQSAFMNNLKQVQAEFEKSLNEQQLGAKQATSTAATAPLGDQELKSITKEIESYTQNNAKEGDASFTPKQFCTRQGGVYKDRSGVNGAQYGVCTFTDGSECHALLFSRGKCHIGQYMKAEDGIPKWPDLSIAVPSIDYCRRTNGVLASVSKEQARGICVDGITVQNVGIARSAKAQVEVDDKRYDIPPLQPQESFSLPASIIIQKTPDLSTIAIDIQTSFHEIDKENNTYHYAAKTK